STDEPAGVVEDPRRFCAGHADTVFQQNATAEEVGIQLSALLGDEAVWVALQRQRAVQTVVARNGRHGDSWPGEQGAGDEGSGRSSGLAVKSLAVKERGGVIEREAPRPFHGPVCPKAGEAKT